jgi:hypothetical protein
MLKKLLFYWNRTYISIKVCACMCVLCKTSCAYNNNRNARKRSLFKYLILIGNQYICSSTMELKKIRNYFNYSRTTIIHSYYNFSFDLFHCNQIFINEKNISVGFNYGSIFFFRIHILIIINHEGNYMNWKTIFI